MSRRLCSLLPLLLLWLCLAAPTPAQAQSDAAARNWERSLDLVEQQLTRADTTEESAERFLGRTAEIRQAAQAAIEEAQPKLGSVERRLAALGPAPQEGAQEAPEVAEQRANLNEELQRLNAQIGQAKVAVVRADELDQQIGSLSQRKRFEALFRLYPFPWLPETWQESVPEFLAVAGEILGAPADWWEGVSREELLDALSQRAALLLALALLLGFILRRWLLRRYGRNAAEQDPAYSARLVAAVAIGAARGIIPALSFAGLWYVASTAEDLAGTQFGTLISWLFRVLAFFSLAWAMPYAVLSPSLPQWRLLPVSPDNARKLGRRFTLLAAFFAVQIFMSLVHQQIGVSDAYFSLATLLLNVVPAVLVIEMSRSRYWLIERRPAALAADQPEDDQEPGVAAQTEGSFWNLVRRLSAVIAGASLLASLAGYADLADFLFQNLLLSILILAAIAILRGLGRDLIGIALRSGFMREALELRHVARSRIKFWLRALLDAGLIVVAVLAIAALWSSPFGEFWSQVRRLMSGVTIGDVTISFADILIALGVFALILLLTRLGQRFLNNRVLPQTGFDSGVQNSLSAGFGYLGILLAAIFGISALGVDLSNVALIAGALSVGIGFGLQTIVSNFVSGIILLIERPIKAGDWVLVGGNEGTVKRITVRSTELQTFQRASVIIPNSDFISTPVVNWTHKDHYGRIEVAVGVAYGSDLEKVRQVLLDCAQHHERVLTSPEPHVIFMNFGASSLDFELRCFTSEVGYRLLISSDLRFAIDKAFREAGIEIPFPQQVVHAAGAPLAPARHAGSAGQSPAGVR